MELLWSLHLVRWTDSFVGWSILVMVLMTLLIFLGDLLLIQDLFLVLVSVVEDVFVFLFV